MPTFTTNFTLNVIPVWEQLFRRLNWRADAPRVAIEIGSHEGASALWWLGNLLRAPESRLHCVDPWEEKPERFALFQKNIAESPARAKVRVLRMRSFDGLLQLIGERVAADFIYVDGSHTAPDVMEDLVLAFRLLKVGGLMLCDDYQWNDPQLPERDLLERPKMAIDAFTTLYADKIRVALSVPIIQAAFVKVKN